MKFYKTLLLKAYFDKGLGLTSYFKYMIAFYGMSSVNVKSTMLIGIIYGFFCFFLGWIWYQFKFIETENEISNLFNPFQREVREKILN